MDKQNNIYVYVENDYECLYFKSKVYAIDPGRGFLVADDNGWFSWVEIRHCRLIQGEDTADGRTSI